jgi:tricorn protease
MKKTLTLLMCFVGFQTFSQSTLLLRQPAISPDGNVTAFSYQGDIWTVPTAGGRANRLTIHEAYETSPIFSPDGKQIAFTGARFGNNDIFVMPATGGMPQRLTFHSASDVISSWTQANQILFSTTREFRQVERPAEIYSINPAGGTESRVLDALGFDPIYSADGRYLAFVRGDINPVARQDYVGSSDRDIWIYDTQKKTYHEIEGFATNDISPQFGPDNTLYFLSSIEGAYNLYSLSLKSGLSNMPKPTKITNFKDESIRAFSLAGNGKSLVFEKDVHLYHMVLGSAAKVIDVQINADDRFDAFENKTYSSNAGDLAISPNGKLMAFGVRGEIFVKEVDKEASRSINVSEHAFRDLEPVFLNDSTLLFTSDREKGNFDIYLLSSADAKQPNIFKSLKHSLKKITNTSSDESQLTVSPDRKKLAYVRGRGTMVVADIDANGTLSNEKIINNTWDSPNGMAWSPDSKWLAYALSDLYFNQEIFIQAADNSTKAVNVSMHPRSDSRPTWSPDGSKLAFISGRSASRSDDVYFVWLKKADYEKVSQDWQEKDKPEEADAPKKGKEKAEVKPIEIDFDKIYERVVQVTSFPGDESNIVISKDGETFYYTTTSSNAKGRDLYSIKWDGKGLKEITKGGTNPSNVFADNEAKYLYYTKSGSFARIDLKTSSSESLPFAAKMKIDFTAERTQVYEEAWRTINNGFYDPNFHGKNWKKLHDKYLDRCINASTSQDFRDMFNLLLGELNSSHMGLSVTDRSETQNQSTGLIGAELKPEKDGMRVVHVVPETPADRATSKLMEGDKILKVNDIQVSQADNFYEKLNDLVNEKVILTVEGADKTQREVIIRLTASISNNLYSEWVENRKKIVDQLSKGRLGYIHIKGMDFASFEVVEREFMAAGYGKDGLVIDVRYNGGGSTTDYLMTILNYKQHAYTIPRGASENLEKDKLKFREYYPIGERLVYAAWTKPSIALCNEGSYSNAEIFSHAYKHLGIGKLVGLPTNGSVISTGGKGLMDGSFIRLPGRGWFTKATDKNQELGPAIPDILVENTPDWLATGQDNQLKVAVEELLKDIDLKK